MIDALIHLLSSLVFPVQGVPWALRAVLGAAGLLLVFRGAAWTWDGLRVGLACAGAVAALGVLGTVELPVAWARPTVIAGVTGMAAALALWTEVVHPRLGLMVLGAVCGSVAGAAARELFASEGGVSWVMATMVLGGSVLPWTYEAWPKILSPFAGAVVVACAAGAGQSLPLIVGLWALGVTVQLFTKPEIVLFDERSRATGHDAP